MMLDHLGHPDAAAAILGDRAALAETARTRDLGGSADSHTCGKAIADASRLPASRTRPLKELGEEAGAISQLTEDDIVW